MERNSLAGVSRFELSIVIPRLGACLDSGLQSTASLRYCLCHSVSGLRDEEGFGVAY